MQSVIEYFSSSVDAFKILHSTFSKPIKALQWLINIDERLPVHSQGNINFHFSYNSLLLKVNSLTY